MPSPPAPITVTHTRRRLMEAIGRGRVVIGSSGTGIYRKGAGFIGIGARVDGEVRKLEAAGWARIGRDGGTYELTEQGRAALGRCVNCDDPACAGCWGADTYRHDDWRPA